MGKALSKCLGHDFCFLKNAGGKEGEGSVKPSCGIADINKQYSLEQRVRAIVLCPQFGDKFETVLHWSCQNTILVVLVRVTVTIATQCTGSGNLQ